MTNYDKAQVINWDVRKIFAHERIIRYLWAFADR